MEEKIYKILEDWFDKKDAIEARKVAEKNIFGEFLKRYEEKKEIAT